MTPYETVLQHFKLPATLHGRPFVPDPRQIDAINTMCQWDTVGNYLDTGTGKTFTETMVSLYRLINGAKTAVIIMPPVLVPQWGSWLTNVTRIDGSPLKVLQYRGTPAQRRDLDMDADFILVGIQIFKLDYERFTSYFLNRTYHVAVDEATMIANVNSDNHEKVADFTFGMTRSMLTGTPANNPLDAYGLIKFTAPGTYLSFRQFCNMHVEKEDHFGKPKEYCNLDMLKANLAKNSVRILFEEMYPDAETPLFVPEVYDLDPAHMKLYRKLAEEQLLALPDGGKIDVTSANRLTHALGQVVVNLDHFSGKPEAQPVSFDVIANHLNELGSEKLVVFAIYRMTIASLTRRFAKFGAVAVNGDVSPAEKQAAVSKFINDPACRMICIHPRSAGFGLDGLQHVCNHALFIEPVQQPRDFHQCVARLKRTGQRKRVVVWLPTANGTLQVRGFKNLLANDTLINQVVRNATDLRAAIFGQ